MRSGVAVLYCSRIPRVDARPTTPKMCYCRLKKTNCGQLSSFVLIFCNFPNRIEESYFCPETKLPKIEPQRRNKVQLQVAQSPNVYIRSGQTRRAHRQTEETSEKYKT